MTKGQGKKELAPLVSERASIRSQLTRFTEFVDTFNINESSIIELQKRLEKVETSLYREFDNVHRRILALDESPEQEHELSSFENIYYKYTSRAEELIKQHTALIIHSNDQALVGSSNSINNLQNMTNLSRVKLPTIKLPNFQGSFDNWLEFSDTFDSLIRQSIELNNIQKFHYLKSCVSGEAARIIGSLETTAANFEVAWSLLCDRYNNKKLLINNHIKTLYHISSVTKESSVQLRSLVDNINRTLRSLETLGQVIDNWDPLLIYMISTKLDSITCREWEEEAHKSVDCPSLDTFLTFLKNKADLLETIETKKHDVSKAESSKNLRFRTEGKNRSFVTTKFGCSLCKKPHRVYKCPDFHKLSSKDKLNHIQKTKLCVNCLNAGHDIKDCKFGPCRECSQKHNSLLHQSFSKTNDTSNDTASDTSENKSVVLSSCNNFNNQALLSTALVKVFDSQGQAHTCRALLDSGSESSFVTQRFAETLGVQKSKYKISIIGIGQVSSPIKEKCDIHIQSLHNGFSSTISCLIIPDICERIPMNKIDASSLKIPHNIFLADPQFYKSSSIDMLIGVDLFWSLLCIGQIKLGNGLPILQKTKLGWIVSGTVNTSSQGTAVSYCNFSKNVEVQKQLEKFWEIQEVHSIDRVPSNEQTFFEDHFISTYRRHDDGKFIVSIPFKDNTSLLGDSSDHAKKRFYNLERKLHKESDTFLKYAKFIDDYAALGHMSKLTDVPRTLNAGAVNFFPHHCVMKEDSLTTKLRVVFDGSCPTSSGVSLNDIQATGANLQDELFAILLRFRQFSFVVSSDIEKMYRCIWIAPEQRSLQLIYWRKNVSDPLDIYHLNTVTYGTASASFLAIRCLHQLAIDNAEHFPDASSAIKHSFYVDDFLHGSDSKGEISKICYDVSNILKQGGFNLRKWVSNEPSILDGIADGEEHVDMLKLGSSENSKTLGVFWNPQTDLLSFRISAISFDNRSTKRAILSGISQIYDPLGLLSACIITVKILLQKLWSEKLNWDESVPIELHTKWVRFRKDILHLRSLKIPRHVKMTDSIRNELHCFCDASQDAYATCIYMRSENNCGDIEVRLLCAKSKVAPLKLLTIPRLELQGALIMARLADKVSKCMNIASDNIYYWTDSSIVLGWLRTSPSSLKTFVANRISETQCLTDISMWRHVSSSDNPADLASRGVLPSSLLSCDLWWHGPSWLIQNSDFWPARSDLVPNSLPETKTVLLASQKQKFVFPFERFSNYLRLIRALCYCLRISNLCKGNKLEKVISVEEMDKAVKVIVRIIQKECFPTEYLALSQGRPIHNKSQLVCLSPFLGQDGVIRVGGRLSNSQFAYEKQHPMVLPKNHHFVKLIFRYEHVRLGHAGPTQLLASVRDRFWPIAGKNTAKQAVHACVRCFKVKPTSVSPLMGQLPESRVTPSFPFSCTGVDYAGPFELKDKKGRGCKIVKGYICLFVCFSTKAIHLELVTDLSTDTFLAAFRRFISRRGKPERILSDNGTNFIGARNELNNLGQFLQGYQDKIIELVALEGIEWKFIPPYSPHFGGLWEAGVKLTKYHLKRILANASFTYEEFLTAIIQVEGILNSRPLSSLSTNPNDLSPLTPSHFLIGRSITTFPDNDLTNMKENRLSKWQHIQLLVQRFWTRWSIEYLHELQSRKKWNRLTPPIEVGMLVLIKERNQPPLCWALGRIESLHTGRDKIPRVASLRTAKGIVRRAIVNLCPLPLEGENVLVQCTEASDASKGVESHSFQALKLTNGSFIVNGDWKFSNSRVFSGAGTKFVYVRQDENSLENLKSPGPLTSPVDIMIVNYQANTGIKYSYSLPVEDTPVIAPPLIKRPVIADPSVIETRRLEIPYNNVTLKDESRPQILHPGPRRTRVRRKHFHWKITGLTACSKSCGGGIQTYVKTCIRELGPHNQMPVHDRRCAHLDSPTSTPVRCNMDPCPPSWELQWTDCSVTCGEGVQQNIPRCKQDLPNGPVPVSESQCLMITKPAVQSRPCKKPACESISDNELPGVDESRAWLTGNWSQCSVTCGTGHRTRSVICPPGHHCKAEHRPAHAEYCNMGPCSASFLHVSDSDSRNSVSSSSWLVTEWSHCSEACGTGYQTRLALCEKEENTACSEGSKPELSRACSSEKECGGQWFTGPWGSCSDSCSGRAKQKREVACIVKIRGQSHITNEMTCSAHLKPPEEQPCEGSCPPHWFVGEWGQCEDSCPVGVQRREVKCLDSHGRKHNGCTVDEMPVSKRTCACPVKISTDSREKYKPAQDEPADRSCVDKIRKCKLAVQARLCHYPYYTTHCCESCRKAQDMFE